MCWVERAEFRRGLHHDLLSGLDGGGSTELRQKSADPDCGEKSSAGGILDAVNGAALLAVSREGPQGSCRASGQCRERRESTIHLLEGDAGEEDSGRLQHEDHAEEQEEGGRGVRKHFEKKRKTTK